MKRAKRSRRINLDLEVRKLEMRHIIHALRQTGGQKTEAARLLGIPRTTLNYKIHCLKIPIDYPHSKERVQECGIKEQRGNTELQDVKKQMGEDSLAYLNARFMTFSNSDPKRAK